MPDYDHYWPFALAGAQKQKSYTPLSVSGPGEFDLSRYSKNIYLPYIWFIYPMLYSANHIYTHWGRWLNFFRSINNLEDFLSIWVGGVGTSFAFVLPHNNLGWTKEKWKCCRWGNFLQKFQFKNGEERILARYTIKGWLHTYTLN